MDDVKAKSDDDNNYQAPGDPVGRPYRPQGPMCAHSPERPQGSTGPVAHVSIYLHVKYPISSAKDGEDAESQLFPPVTA